MQDESYMLALQFEPNHAFTLPFGDTISATCEVLLSATSESQTKVITLLKARLIFLIHFFSFLQNSALEVLQICILLMLNSALNTDAVISRQAVPSFRFFAAFETNHLHIDRLTYVEESEAKQRHQMNIIFPFYSASEMSSKTRAQLFAEQKLLQHMLFSLIVSSADEKLKARHTVEPFKVPK